MKNPQIGLTVLLVGAFIASSVLPVRFLNTILDTVMIGQVEAASSKEQYFGGPVLDIVLCGDEGYEWMFIGAPANDFFIYWSGFTKDYTKPPSRIGDFILGSYTGEGEYECTIDGETVAPNTKNVMLTQGASSLGK